MSGSRRLKLPADAADGTDTRLPDGDWYSYAIVRLVPRVERGESLNVGIILFARTARYLDARVELDDTRLRALAPDADVDQIRQHLAVFVATAAGDAAGGAIAAMSQTERFHWLVAPRSTIIQTSPVHVGRSEEPARALEELMDRLVRTKPVV